MRSIGAGGMEKRKAANFEAIGANVQKFACSEISGADSRTVNANCCLFSCAVLLGISYCVRRSSTWQYQ